MEQITSAVLDTVSTLTMGPWHADDWLVPLGVLLLYKMHTTENSIFRGNLSFTFHY